jgi:amino acid transporter
VEAITAAKLIPLLVLVAVGGWSLNPDFLRASMPTISQVGQVAIILIFAFVGVEVALTPSGEIRDSSRTVPRAILSALAIATLVYLAVQIVAQGVLGPELPKHTDAPLAETAGRILGDAGRLFLLAGGTVSIFGYIAGDMLGTPRALLALAENGVLPQALARVHPRYRTPAAAIMAYAIIVAALAISSTFERLVIMANVSALLLYLLCVAASYQLQRRDVRMAGEPFTLPGGATVQVLAASGIVWLLMQATAREWRILAAVVAAASVYYLIKGPSLRRTSAFSASPVRDR